MEKKNPAKAGFFFGYAETTKAGSDPRLEALSGRTACAGAGHLLKHRIDEIASQEPVIGDDGRTRHGVILQAPFGLGDPYVLTNDGTPRRLVPTDHAVIDIAA